MNFSAINQHGIASNPMEVISKRQWKRYNMYKDKRNHAPNQVFMDEIERCLKSTNNINAENIIYFMWDLSNEFYEYENLQFHEEFYEKKLYEYVKNFFEDLKKKVKKYKLKKKLICLYASNYAIVIAFLV